MTSNYVITGCAMCAHWRRGAPGITCDAFPEGIPLPIWNEGLNHRRPYPSDGGVRFKLLELGEPDLDDAARAWIESHWPE